MTFISYAQNYEDVMLRRALKDIDKGFYIDVGANDPVIDSVTKAFYNAGWRGINIEPVAEWFNKLQQDRPDDINLQVAVGARKSTLNFFEVVGTGLSTMEASIAERHAQETNFDVVTRKVPVVRLTTICNQHAEKDIHFLKIDVEGSALAVLQGLDLKKIRPWIILVEATLPNTQTEDFDQWEHLICDRGYHYVYFDGLNRYYVADEHGELDSSFNAPPNCFDYFKRASEDWLGRHAQGLEKQIAVYQEKSQQHGVLIREKEIREQELLLSLIEKETRLQERAAELIERERKITRLDALLNKSRDTEERLRNEALLEQQARDKLKTERDSLTLKLAEHLTLLNDKEEQIVWLNNEWESAKQKVEELHQSNHHWWSAADQQSNELTELTTKVEELNSSSHHWWLEADRLGKELHTVYNSKSWRITWPLRKLMQFTQWLFVLPIRMIVWMARLPRRALRWLLVKVIAFAMRRPSLKQRGLRWVNRYPQLKSHLKRFAIARGIIADTAPPVPPQPSTPVVEPLQQQEGGGAEVDLSALTPRAREIYAALRQAINEQQEGR